MIKAENLHKKYNKGKSNEFHALKGVNLQIDDGEIVAIIGKSGAGKSTLLHILSCIDGFDEGSVEIDGKNIFKLSDAALAKIRNKKIGIVLQDFALINEYTVLENVMVPLYFTKMAQKKRKEKAMKTLKQLGIDDLAEKSANQLSGGQKQRVAIARAIVNAPKYLFADSKTTQEILDVLKNINSKGITIIIITHEKSVSDFCGRTITIDDGMIKEV